MLKYKVNIGYKMMKKLLVLSGLVVSCLSNQLIAADFSVIEVKPSIYMLQGVGGFTGGNIGLSVGDDGVIMIDDSMPPFLDKMNQAVASITKQPISFLINTHVHGDHTGNNKTMGQVTTIVAHENLRLNMLKKGVKTKEGMKPAPLSALPVITFSQSINFHLNGEDAHVFHAANAHTDGDAIIHFTKANVIHTGDTFFNGIYPYIDINNGGSVNGYIAAQQKILSLSDQETKIIPGHGNLANKAELTAAVNMLIDSKKIVSSLIDEGKTEDQVVSLNPLKKYHDAWSWRFITTEKMTRQVYKSLKK